MVSQVHFSSATAQWRTPSGLVAEIVSYLGQIDVDPCADWTRPDHVPAKTHYTELDNGLAREWRGVVYMNPPYGRQIGAWVDKLLDQYGRGNCTEAIALLPARVDTKWFQRLIPFPVLFFSGRLKFNDGPQAAPFPSALVYVAPQVAWHGFKLHFGHLGIIYKPY